MKKSYFYGIYGIRYIWHGSWADPEIIWHNKSFNYYDLETPLYEIYKEDAPALDFEIWVKTHWANECNWKCLLQHLHSVLRQ